MKKSLVILLSLLVFSFAVSAQDKKPTPPPTEDDDVVKISTNLIQIDVTVTDKDGKVVTDLKPEDFAIFENGKKQDLTNFLFVTSPNQTKSVAIKKTGKQSADKTAVPVPPVTLKPTEVKRTIALIVDDLGLSFESLVRVRTSLKNFVDEQMQPNDLVAIILTGNGTGSLQQFTSDKRMLYAAIEKIKWSPQGRAGITPFAPLGQISMNPTTEQSTETTDENSESTTSTEDQSATIQQQVMDNNLRQDIFSVGTLGAINYVVGGIKDLPGRKSVMLFSDGFPICNSDSETNTYDAERCEMMSNALRTLTDYCNRAAVSIYSFDARGLQYTGLTAADATSSMSASQTAQLSQTRSQAMTDNQQGLSYLADETGGRTFFNRNDINESINFALEDQNGYYLLGYQPDSDSFDPKKLRFNKIEIRVTKPGYNVRYRSGFLGFTNDSAAAAAATSKPQDKTFNALLSPFTAGEIPLRLNTLFENNEQGSFVNSYLHIDAKNLTFTDQPDGSKKASFEVMAASFGENGATIDQVGRTYRLSFSKETYEQLQTEGFVYSFVFPVKKPGAFQMRVAVRDTESSKIGSASQFVEVPDLKKGELTLSGITLEAMIDEANDQTEHGTINDITIGRGDPRTDTSLRQFQQGSIVKFAVDIYNAKTDKVNESKLQTQVKLFRDGEAIVNPLLKSFSPDKNYLKRINFGGKMVLGEKLLPGEYVLQIIVKDTLAKEKDSVAVQWVQFEIVE